MTLPWAPELRGPGLTRRTPFPAYGSCCLKAGIEGEGNGVRSARLWAGLLGLVKVVVEGVEFDEAEQCRGVGAAPQGDQAPVSSLREALLRL